MGNGQNKNNGDNDDGDMGQGTGNIIMHRKRTGHLLTIFCVPC